MPVREFSYAHDDARLSGRLASPGGKVRAGAVVFGDVWGMSEALQHRAGMLAEQGFLALAADMYGSGRLAASHAEARGLVAEFAQDTARLRARAGAAVEALRSQLPAGAPVVAVGYCFGGKVVLELARSGMDLAAAATFHGGLETQDPAAPGAIRAPIIVFAGAEDPMVPPSQVARFEDEMRAAGADWQVVVLGGALHAFAVPGSELWNIPGVGHNPVADRRSWRAMSVFFEDVLAARDGRREERS